MEPSDLRPRLWPAPPTTATNSELGEGTSHWPSPSKGDRINASVFGDVAYVLKRPRSAEVYFKQSDDAFASYRLGMMVLARGRNERAELLFEKVTTMEPDFADGHYMLGLCYQGQGRHGDHIRRALRRLRYLYRGMPS